MEGRFDIISLVLFVRFLLTSTPHTPNQDLNQIRGHILPRIRFYHNDKLLYCFYILLTVHLNIFILILTNLTH